MTLLYDYEECEIWNMKLYEMVKNIFSDSHFLYLWSLYAMVNDVFSDITVFTYDHFMKYIFIHLLWNRTDMYKSAK